MEDRSGQTSIFDRRLDILVLMGGPSCERAVSLLSGAAVAAALEACGHNVRQADIGPTDPSALDGEAPDAVFIALHGEFGEDGQVQLMCEERNLAYVGAGPHASELAMDKAASKQIYRRSGLATPDWAVIEEFDTPARQARLMGEVPLPCVLKPINGGSSLDVHLADDPARRGEALEALLDEYARAMVEQRIDGRELTVGVLGERALPVMEIRPHRRFYDYDAKYVDDDTEYVFDHGLDAATVADLQAAALTAHEALGCRDMSRSDFMLDGDGRSWLLETNTIPGFTSHSLLPKAAAHAGVPFGRLCEQLVCMAMDRKRTGGQPAATGTIDQVKPA